MEKETLEKVVIHGAKLKVIIETNDKLYLLYSMVGREPGTEPWFVNSEISDNWVDNLSTKNIKYAQELGFNLKEKDLELLKKEGYTILGFDKP